MPSKAKSPPAATTNPRILFVTLVCISLILWIFYRALFNFSVLFDETLGKAIFFGLPIIIYVTSIKDENIIESVRPYKLFPGLLRGLAFGGIFGFIVVVFSMIKSGRIMVAAPLFAMDEFWWEFFLALLTGFWESLFFFGFMQTVLRTVFKEIEVMPQILLISLLFLLFHLSNIMLRFGGLDVSFLIALLYFFGLGQAIIFANEKNVYTIMMSHAIWGLALMINL